MTQGEEKEHRARVELTKDTRYVTLTGKLWYVELQYFGNNQLCCDERQLYELHANKYGTEPHHSTG